MTTPRRPAIFAICVVAALPVRSAKIAVHPFIPKLAEQAITDVTAEVCPCVRPAQNIMP